MKRRLGLAVGLGLATAVILYLVEITTLVGAHPQWADQLFWSGAALGVLLALVVIQFHFVPRTLGLSFLAIAAWLTADYGKARFAASFAEDAIAGQMWFYGWHVLVIAMIAHVVSASYERLGTA